jgi:putative OPT family oligopeptide transporter
MQMVGTVSAAVVMAPVLTLLLKAYGFAGHESARESPLIAVQANLMASVAKGVFAKELTKALPWTYIFIGMGLAVVVIILDEYLVRRGSSFRTPVLAVAIGIYLPLQLEVPILAGGIIHQVIKVVHQRAQTAKDAAEISSRHGLLLASGLITGEALIGIALAVPIVLSGNPKVLAVLEKPLGAWPGVILLAAIAYWLFRTGSGKTKK